MKILSDEEKQEIPRKYLPFGNSGRSDVLDLAEGLRVNDILYLNFDEWDLKGTPIRMALINRFKKKGKKFTVVSVRELMNPEERGYLVQRMS